MTKKDLFESSEVFVAKLKAEGEYVKNDYTADIITKVDIVELVDDDILALNCLLVHVVYSMNCGLFHVEIKDKRYMIVSFDPYQQ